MWLETSPSQSADSEALFNEEADSPSASSGLLKGMQMENGNEKTPVLEDVRQVSDGWLKKYVLAYRLPDGTKFEYESVSRKDKEAYERELKGNSSNNQKRGDPDAICIVPVLPDGSIVLIREFRYAINDWIIAFPAGLMEPDEDIGTCIERELLEETGCKLRGNPDDAIALLPQSGYSSVGMTNENVMIAKAFVEPIGEQHLEHSEFIEIFTLRREEIDDFLENNEDPIGTRCQLVLECLRKHGVF